MPKNKENNLKHIWSLLCSGVSIDQKRNNLTLYNIFEQIKVPKNHLATIPTQSGEKLPAVPLAFNLVSTWRRIESEKKLRADALIEYTDPSGKIMQKATYPIEMAEGINRFRGDIQWAGIRVTTSGTYTFRISLKNKEDKKFVKIAEVYLDVEILDNEPDATKSDSKKK